MPLPNNQILNPEFSDGDDGLKYWNHRGDVIVIDWPTSLPSVEQNLFGQQCIALGPGGEIGQLLGFMPTQHSLWFGIQPDDSTPIDLTVTVTYTDREMNTREVTQNKTSSDVERIEIERFVFDLMRIQVPLDEDTFICCFTVTNNVPEEEGIAPVYLGSFYLEVEFDENFIWVDPRFLWLAFSFRRYGYQGSIAEPRGFWTPPPKRAKSANEKMLAARIDDLERKLDRLIKRLGVEEEQPMKPSPKQEKIKE